MMVPILRDVGLAEQVRPGDLELLALGFVFTEGPLELPDGSVLFQDIKAERTYRVDMQGNVSLIREHTGAANGQTWGPSGQVVFCEQNWRRVSELGEATIGPRALLETWEGRRLNSPNDIVARSDGLMFFTDPPYGTTPETKELTFQAVWALDPRTESARPLVDDFEKPNGLAFSPDAKSLYVCDTGRYHVRVFEVSTDGSLTGGRVLASFDPAEPGGPDGMKVDLAGRLYVAVAQGIWVLEPEGRLLGILATPRRPSNLAWCGPNLDVLAITAVDAVHRLQLGVPGIRPPFRPDSVPAFASQSRTPEIT
jgi:gluconolactonase